MNLLLAAIHSTHAADLLHHYRCAKHFESCILFLMASPRMCPGSHALPSNDYLLNNLACQLPPHFLTLAANISVIIKSGIVVNIKILLYSTMTKLISILVVLGALSGSVCFAFQASYNVGKLVTNSKSPTLLNMAPKYNKQSQTWIPSDPAVRVLQFCIGALWRYVL